MLNKVQIIGRVGRKPESRQAGDSQVVNFSVAVSEKYKNKSGNQQEKTEWVNIVAWRRLGEICAQYLDKGSLVYIEGKLATRSWGDGDAKRYATEVIASEMKMLGAKSSGQSMESHGYTSDTKKLNYKDTKPQIEQEDDLPF